MSDPALAARFAACRAARRAALIPYLTAGYPDRATSLAALQAAADAGADVLEVGIPFSDPVADGPVIQHSIQQALAGGMTVAGALGLMRDVKRDVPLVAFSYLNPLLAYGLPRFLDEAVDAGVAGLLVTDLPAGADPALEETVRASPLDLIRLIALTTDDRRLAGAAGGGQGFLYLIARLGVTGAATAVGPDLEAAVARVRAVSPLPVAIGFGIGTGTQAAAVARFADGVVVGSALVRRLDDGVGPMRALVRELRDAIGEAAPR